MREQLEAAGRAWEAETGPKRRLATLEALCDTWVPAVDPPEHAPDLGGFWERRASDLNTHLVLAGHISLRLPQADQDGLAKLLDLLAVTGFRRLPRRARAAELAALRATSGEVAGGLDGLRALTMMYFYALPDATGENPNWAAGGYRGPPEIEVPAERAIDLLEVDPGAPTLELDADVCIVGSGAGGGVLAGELAMAGLEVVVLEAGGGAQEADFSPHDLEAQQQLYWRGGYTPTADRMVTVVAGGTLGGGTTVNWTNCVLPPERLRVEWAAEHGLAGLDGADFQAHLDAVLKRIGATDDCSDLNDPNARLAAGAEALGWSWRRTMRNADPKTYDPETAGHMGFGDRSGSKLGVTRTYLADAVGAGTRVVVDCRADRVLVERGRAAGVAGTLRHADGGQTEVTVRARTVVVAGGALESPALLLRSGIGGPCVGHYLRLHPVSATAGIYDDEQQGWWGAPQTVIVDEHAALTEGYGYLLEVPHYSVAGLAANLPWRSGRDHKLLMSAGPRVAAFLGLVRDRGAGRVTIDEAGEAVVTYPLEDRLDREHLHQSVSSQVHAHVAAGARLVVDFEPRRSLWRRGDDVEAYLERLAGLPFGAGGRNMFCAHQMGTARMGRDRATSVADPEGALHDTPGVWIGDASAFPTASGVNPMVTCMALARRTAHAILAAEPASTA